MLPVAVWILWKRPEWRIPGAIMGLVFVALTFATGEMNAFISTVLRSDDMLTFARNFGPSRQFGPWWLIVGIPLAAWLTWRGRLGFASLAVSPYLLPYHFLIGLLETTRARVGSVSHGGSHSAVASTWKSLRRLKLPRATADR